MPRPSPFDRARLWVEKMPAAESGNGGHAKTFAVAMVLLQGFDLPRHEARAILDEFNARCAPPWNDHDLEHKLNQADKKGGFSRRRGCIEPRGCLKDEGGDAEPSAGSSVPTQSRPAPGLAKKPDFDLAKLTKAAGHFTETVTGVWLANRSALDPALVTPAKFLSSLYKGGEKVVVFTNDKTQGQALWPAETVPTTGPRGVWYLAQPVDGLTHPNPRSRDDEGNPKPSRRSEESVTAWRYFVLESDIAPAREWLGALVQLPLRISAIYTSGGRSIHALVRVDAPTKDAWDQIKHEMQFGLVLLGADPKAMSAIRLTRLPGCFREGKDVNDGTGRLFYRQFARPQLQKLLYLNPDSQLRPLCDILPKRDTEKDWLRLAAAGVADADTTGGAWIERGLEYYAKHSPRLAEALAQFRAGNSTVA